LQSGCADIHRITPDAVCREFGAQYGAHGDGINGIHRALGEFIDRYGVLVGIFLAIFLPLPSSAPQFHSYIGFVLPSRASLRTHQLVTRLLYHDEPRFFGFGDGPDPINKYFTVASISLGEIPVTSVRDESVPMEHQSIAWLQFDVVPETVPPQAADGPGTIFDRAAGMVDDPKDPFQDCWWKERDSAGWMEGVDLGSYVRETLLHINLRCD
jgi:hypothetical protein